MIRIEKFIIAAVFVMRPANISASQGSQDIISAIRIKKWNLEMKRSGFIALNDWCHDDVDMRNGFGKFDAIRHFILITTAYFSSNLSMDPVNVSVASISSFEYEREV